jgi:hypothetical protein
MRPTDAIKPSFKWSEVELDAMIRRWTELEAVEVLNSSLLPPGTNTLLAGFTTSKDFDVDDVMLLGAQLCVEVGAAVKDQVSGLHLFQS